MGIFERKTGHLPVHWDIRGDQTEANEKKAKFFFKTVQMVTKLSFNTKIKLFPSNLT